MYLLKQKLSGEFLRNLRFRRRESNLYKRLCETHNAICETHNVICETVPARPSRKFHSLSTAKPPEYNGPGKNEMQLLPWIKMITAHISLITDAETVTDKVNGQILKLFLGPKVQTALSSEIKYNDDFWSDPQNVFDELKLIYERPNEVEHSLQKLQDLKMHGKNLSTYHRAHIELCSMAKLDPDGKPQLYLFVKNQINNATFEVALLFRLEKEDQISLVLVLQGIFGLPLPNISTVSLRGNSSTFLALSSQYDNRLILSRFDSPHSMRRVKLGLS